MMMKSKKTNKKLALMVGMALSFGVAYGMAPSDAALAAEYELTYSGSAWTATCDGSAVEGFDIDEDLGNIINGSEVNTIKFATWEAFTKAFPRTGDVTTEVKGGTVINVAESNSSLNIVFGAEGGMIYNRNFGGNIASATVDNQGGEPLEITMLEGSKIDSLTVSNGELKLNGSNNNFGTVTVDGGELALKDADTTITADKLDVDGGFEATFGTIAVKEIVATGEINLSGATVGDAVQSISTDGNVTVDALGANTTTVTGAAVTIGDTVNNGNTSITASGALTVGGDGITNAGNVTAASVNAGSLKASGDVNISGTATVSGELSAGGNLVVNTIAGGATSISGNNIEITDEVPNSIQTIIGTGDVTLTGGVNSLTEDSVISAGGTLDLGNTGFKTDGTNGTISANSITTTGDVTVSENSTFSTGSLTAGDLKIEAASSESETAGSLNVTDSITVNGQYSNTTEGAVTTNKFTLGDGATVESGSTVNTNTLVVGRTGASTQLENLTANGVQKVIVNGLSDSDIGEGGLLTDNELQKAINKAVTGDEATDVIVVDGTAVEGALATAQATINDMETKKKAEGGLSDTLAANGVVAKYASADPFATKLPSASEIVALASDNDINTRLRDYHESLAEAKAAAEALGNTALANEYAAKLANTASSASGQAAKLTAAVQQAGKTAAAPGVTAARAATAITSVLTNNVVTRTAEIRGFASAVDEGRPEPDKMWFQYKHTNMDVDGGDVYSKSTINTNNFQLGYDTQIGTNDYLGAYIGTTTGNADFNGPARNGRIDIDNSFDFGVYGTHMLPNDQYIDYMVHTGKFDSEYDSSKWGTTDTGAMVGYGAKIAQGDRLTLNPYIQLAYDKISVDSYTTRAGNVIKSDDSNNWTAKLGMNLIDASGLYGGVAYSRGLSGSYNAYINGVAMPASDNNANVLYLSLGYRANMARNAVLDLSMEKTFMDYKGWTATGKVNFYF